MSIFEYLAKYYEYKLSAPETIYGAMIFAADILVCAAVYTIMMRHRYMTPEPIFLAMPIFAFLSLWDPYLIAAIMLQHLSYAYFHQTELTRIIRMEQTEELNEASQMAYLKVLVSHIDPWKL